MTGLELAQLKKFLRAQYGLGAFAIAPVTGGVVNTNFKISTADGGYLFKIYNFKEAGEVAFEVAALQELGRWDFPCPRLVASTVGSMIGEFGGKPCLLYEFIHGASQRAWDATMLYHVGVLMGRMHALLGNFEPRTRYGVWDHDTLPTLIRTRGQELMERGFPGAKELMTRLTSELTQIRLPHDLPMGFTHQDIKPENVIIRDKNVVGIVDFDNSYYGTLLHDITTTIIWSCYKNSVLDSHLVARLLAGYETQRPLTRDEKKYFDPALKFRLLREAFISPFAGGPERFALTKQRSEYFLRLV